MGTVNQLCTGAEFQSSDQDSLNFSFGISFLKKYKQRSTRVCDDLCTATFVIVEEKKIGRDWVVGSGVKGLYQSFGEGSREEIQILLIPFDE